MPRFFNSMKKKTAKKQGAPDAAKTEDAPKSSGSGAQTTSQPAANLSTSNSALTWNGMPVFQGMPIIQSMPLPDNLQNILQMVYSPPTSQSSKTDPATSNVTQEESSAAAGDAETATSGDEQSPPSNSPPEEAAAIPTLPRYDPASATAFNGMVFNTQNTTAMMPTPSSSLYLNMETRSLYTNSHGHVYSDTNSKFTLGGLPPIPNLPARNRR